VTTRKPKFDALRHRVQRSERLVEGRSHRLQENWQALGTAWRGLWTPWRIVGAGVVAVPVRPRRTAGLCRQTRQRALDGNPDHRLDLRHRNHRRQRGSLGSSRRGPEEPPASAAAAPQRPATATADAEPRAPAPAEAATDLSGS
jgi:hypothetical protein